jgi:hypothetical protein
MKKHTLVALIAVAALACAVALIWMIYGPKPVSNSIQKHPTPAKQSLQIKEWSASIPLQSSITDIYYTYNAGKQEAYISTEQLDTLVGHIGGCTSGLHGIFYKRTSTMPLTLTEQRPNEPLCTVPANSQTEQIGIIQADIRAAAKTAVAE